MKVSVYCLVYNHEKYIRSALEGFVSQKTDFEYEVFVHDDASTDNSRVIIEEYAGMYPDIIKPIFQQENQKSKGVLILGAHILPKMTGEYIAVCEGDDYWTDTSKLQRQVDFLDSHPEYSACVHNTIAKNVAENSEYLMFDHSEDEDILFEDIVKHGGATYQSSSLMYRIKYADNWPSFYYTARGFRDYPLAMYLALCGKIRFLNRTMSVYRLGTAGSWTATTMADPNKRIRHLENVIEVLEEVNRYTENAYENLIEKAIIGHRYRILFIQERYSEMRREPYTELYRSESFSNRLKMRLKQYFTPLYRLYKKRKQQA